jgi:uncharacterized membrane protein YdbT with pleckstrin-like domain
MPYYTKILQADEQVLAVGRLHWSLYVRSVSVLLLAAAIAIGALWIQNPGAQHLVWLAAAAVAVVGLALLLAAAVRRHATEIVVTNLRVIFKRGILSRYTIEMHMNKIETVDVEQGIAGRVFGYGTVLIRGTGSGIEPLAGIGHPLAIRNAIIAG